ncbi:MAG: toprim domain-containing protein, partial [Brevundimonas sp.]
DAGPERPVLAAAITREGRLTGVELTYLRADGRRATDLRLPRKTIGVLPPGCVVVLGPPSERLVVGEGVFTVLSAMTRFVRSGQATLAAHNLARWRPPPEVRDVVIAADPGRVGERAAADLAARLAKAGLLVRIALPDPGHEDWNAQAMAAVRLRP